MNRPADTYSDSDLRSLRVVHSITELKAEDAGCLAVSGSHGGLSAARYAVAARPLLSVFNDAGIGKDDAGIEDLTRIGLKGSPTIVSKVFGPTPRTQKADVMSVADKIGIDVEVVHDHGQATPARSGEPIR